MPQKNIHQLFVVYPVEKILADHKQSESLLPLHRFNGDEFKRTIGSKEPLEGNIEQVPVVHSVTVLLMFVNGNIHRLTGGYNGNRHLNCQIYECAKDIDARMNLNVLPFPYPLRLCDPRSRAILWVLLNIVPEDEACKDGSFLIYRSYIYLM